MEKIVKITLNDKQAKEVYKLLKRETDNLDMVLTLKLKYSNDAKEAMIDKLDIFDSIKGQIIKTVGD